MSALISEMHRRRAAGWLAPLATVAMLAACGDSNGPDGVNFPSLSGAVVAEFCIRGNVVPPASPSGTITDTDCDTGSGYAESFRVRVAESGSHTFETDATFDPVLFIFRVDDINDYDASAVLIESDDDGGPGLNSRFTAGLNPNTEYILIIVGFSDMDTGAYTIDIS